MAQAPRLAGSSLSEFRHCSVCTRTVRPPCKNLQEVRNCVFMEGVTIHKGASSERQRRGLYAPLTHEDDIRRVLMQVIRSS